MTGDRKGFFVSIDGPSGVGKSTTVRELRAALSARSVPAQWTVEPPRGDFLGDFTRTHGGQLHGLGPGLPRRSRPVPAHRDHHRPRTP